MTKILRAVGAPFAYKMRGTSRPHAKFTGDFGNAIEVIRISGRSLRSVFAKNLEPCNFRLLQHNRPVADLSLWRREVCFPMVTRTGYANWAKVAFDPQLTSRRSMLRPACNHPTVAIKNYDSSGL
jgi:hypothetical protein